MFVLVQSTGARQRWLGWGTNLVVRLDAAADLFKRMVSFEQRAFRGIYRIIRCLCFRGIVFAAAQAGSMEPTDGNSVRDR